MRLGGGQKQKGLENISILSAHYITILSNICFFNKISGKLNCSKNKIFIYLQKQIEKDQSKFL